MEHKPEFTEYDTRLGGYAVVIRDGHVLLALWNEPEVPTWTLPGGGIELHEDLEDGVVREVREESGYDVALGRLLGVDTRVTPPERRYHPAGDRFQKSVRVVYEATVTGGDLVAEVDGTTDEARWIPLADVPSLVREPLVREFVG
jgi:8-oxo-dGTP diphosphatase